MIATRGQMRHNDLLTCHLLARSQRKASDLRLLSDVERALVKDHAGRVVEATHDHSFVGGLACGVGVGESNDAARAPVGYEQGATGTEGHEARRREASIEDIGMKACREMHIGNALTAAHEMRTSQQRLNQVTLAVEHACHHCDYGKQNE